MDPQSQPEPVLPAPRRVVALLAPTPRAVAVAAEARRIAGRYDAELSLLHVVSDPDSEQRLRGILADATVPDVESALVVRTGNVTSVVNRYLREVNADLVVAGALEKEGAVTYLLGSVARNLARRAPSSVLLLTSPQKESPGFRQIVVAVQYDDAAADMVRFALDFARREAASAIHIVSEYALSGLRGAMTDGLDMREAAQVRSSTRAVESLRLATFLEDIDCSGVRLVTTTLEGRAGWEASQYARRIRADLMVAAAPRHTGLLGRLFQHGIEYAFEELPCALYLYRPMKPR